MSGLLNSWRHKQFCLTDQVNLFKLGFHEATCNMTQNLRNGAGLTNTQMLGDEIRSETFIFHPGARRSRRGLTIE